MKRVTLYDLKRSAMHPTTRIARRRWALAAALLLGCAGLAARANSGLKGELLNHTSHLAAQPSASTQQGATAKAARVVKFSLFEGGVYPREVHVDSGPIAIAIEDYSGGAMGLVVEREAGQALERVGHVQRDGPGWRGSSVITLEPGRYPVSMADRPSNRALLVVEP